MTDYKYVDIFCVDLKTMLRVLTETVTCRLTLKAVGIEQIFALFVRLDATFRTTDALPRQAPQQPLAFETVGGRRGCPNDEVVWSRAGYWINQSLQRLLVDMLLLHTHENYDNNNNDPLKTMTSDCTARSVARGQ